MVVLLIKATNSGKSDHHLARVARHSVRAACQAAPIRGVVCVQTDWQANLLLAWRRVCAKTGAKNSMHQAVRRLCAHPGRIGVRIRVTFSGIAVTTLRGDVTGLLRRSAAGDLTAREELWAVAHEQLRALARSRLLRESGVPTWQPTELVHEAFLKLCALEMPLRDRAHFLAMAATVMRQVLIDHARSRRRNKRGGGIRAVTLNSRFSGEEDIADVDILDLDRALTELQDLDARKALAIEWSYFGGMTDSELALAMDVSEATVKRDLRSARAWLATALDDAQ